MLDHEQTGQNMNVLNNNENEVTVRVCCRMNLEGQVCPEEKMKSFNVTVELYHNAAPFWNDYFSRIYL